MNPATATAPEPSPQGEEAEPQRPGLQLVSGVDDIEVPEGTVAEAPFTYKIHVGLAEFISKLPSTFTERQPSLQEIIEYSQNSDWTTEQWKRIWHLLRVIVLCIPLGLAAVALRVLAQKPSRPLIALVLLLMLDYAL